MKRQLGQRQTRLNLDLDHELSMMADYLKKEFGVTYGAELVRYLIREAYRRSKGPYSLEK